MAEHSKIEWTDATWNITTGCDVVSPGCTNCYAMRLAGTRLKQHPSRAGLTRDTKTGPVWNGVVRINWDWIDQPLQWSRPRNIFVCAHGDLFHELISKDELVTIYAVMVAAVHLRGHTLQVLTKRADRMCEILNDEEFWEQVNSEAGGNIMERVDALNRRIDDARATCDHYGPDNPPPGIWHSVSCEDQKRAEERVPYLLGTPSVIRGVSAEPLLDGIDFRILDFKSGNDLPEPMRVNDERGSINALTGVSTWPASHYQSPVIKQNIRVIDGELYRSEGEHRRLDWIIIGGESGRGARDCRVEWGDSIQAQCAAAGVACFRKQLGSRPIASDLTGWRAPSTLLPDSSGYLLKLKSSKGGDAEEWPERMRVREFPQVSA